MSEMVEVSKARLMTKRARTIITSIPATIVDALGIEAGSILAWEVEERDGRKVAVLRKLE